MKIIIAAVLATATMINSPSLANPMGPFGEDAGDGCERVQFGVRNSGHTYAVVRLSCPPRHSGAKNETMDGAYKKAGYQCRKGSDTPLSFSGEYTACQQTILVCGAGHLPTNDLVNQLPSDLAQSKVPMPICKPK